MKVILLAVAAVLTLAAAPSSLAAPPAKPAAKPVEVATPFSRRIDFTSAINGQRYSVLVALPTGPKPAGGYPVLYVLDGGSFFGSATEAVRSNQLPVMIAAITYPFDDPAFVAKVTGKAKPADAEAGLKLRGEAVQITRTIDLTPPTSASFLATQKGMETMKTGGADAFLKVIETEVKPKVAAVAAIDASNQALFGHSFGGLAVLRALFTEPTAFRTFVAASPSIWWNDKSILEGEAAFSGAVTAGKAAPRVLLSVGGLEQSPQKAPPGSTTSQADLDALISLARMVDNMTELAARLKALKGGPGYEVRSVVFADETHSTVNQASIARAVRFVAEAGPAR